MGLAKVVSEYARVEFPKNIKLFVVDEQLNAQSFETQLLVAGDHRVMMRCGSTLGAQAIRVYTERPISRVFRILLLDWTEETYGRAVMGYLRFSQTHGVIEVSDYRMSLARLHVPEILRTDSVLMVGVRFETFRKPIQVFTITTHEEDGRRIETRNEIKLVKFGPINTCIVAEHHMRQHNRGGRHIRIRPAQVVPLFTAQEVVEEMSGSTIGPPVVPKNERAQETQTKTDPQPSTSSGAIRKTIHPTVDRPTPNDPVTQVDLRETIIPEPQYGTMPRMYSSSNILANRGQFNSRGYKRHQRIRGLPVYNQGSIAPNQPDWINPQQYLFVDIYGNTCMRYHNKEWHMRRPCYVPPTSDSSSSEEADQPPTFSELRKMEELKQIESLIEVDAGAIGQKTYDCTIDQQFREECRNQAKQIWENRDLLVDSQDASPIMIGAQDEPTAENNAQANDPVDNVTNELEVCVICDHDLDTDVETHRDRYHNIDKYEHPKE